MNSNQNTIDEDKFDFIVEILIDDILKIYEKNKVGEFALPEDLNRNNLTYDFPGLGSDFSIFLDLQLNDKVETFEIDADYYDDDSLIYVTIMTNPKMKKTISQDFLGELNEVIRHEFEHIIQYDEGFPFPKLEPKKSLDYYTQKHELQALSKGFKRKSKIQNLDYETTIRRWFEKYPHKHKLTPKQIDFVVSKILSEK